MGYYQNEEPNLDAVAIEPGDRGKAYANGTPYERLMPEWLALTVGDLFNTLPGLERITIGFGCTTGYNDETYHDISGWANYHYDDDLRPTQDQCDEIAGYARIARLADEFAQNLPLKPSEDSGFAYEYSYQITPDSVIFTVGIDFLYRDDYHHGDMFSAHARYENGSWTCWNEIVVDHQNIPESDLLSGNVEAVIEHLDCADYSLEQWTKPIAMRRINDEYTVITFEPDMMGYLDTE